MQKIELPIVVTTILVFGFALAAGLSISYAVLISLFLVVHVAFFWMIYSILKNGEPSEKSFNEYFYEDREDIRRNN